MARHGEAELKRVLGVPDEVWLGSIDIDWNQLELGRGSDAVVHRAVHAGAHVAVKVLHKILIEPDNVGRREMLQRFGSECRILRRLAHPRVIRFVGIGMAPNMAPCLVVELMDSSLASRVAADPPDSFAQSLTYFLDVAEGLRFLHSQGLLHRDLKPQNVLITAGRAKIADVGLAKVLNGDDAVELADLTRCPGTPQYMPPECFVQGRSYDTKLDIFSLGVTTLSVLGGRAPVPSEARYFRLQDGSREPVPEHERRRGDLARLPARHPMRNLILSCLQDDPGLRPSAESLHVQLMEISHSYSPNYDQSSIGTVIAHLESVLQRVDQQAVTISQLVDQVGATGRRMADLEEQVQLGASRTQHAVLRVQCAVAGTEERLAGVEEQLRDTEHRITQDVAGSQRTTVAIHRCVSGLAEQHRATQQAVAEANRAIAGLPPGTGEPPQLDDWSESSCHSSRRRSSAADIQRGNAAGRYSSTGTFASSGAASPTWHRTSHGTTATSTSAHMRQGITTGSYSSIASSGADSLTSLPANMQQGIATGIYSSIAGGGAGSSTSLPADFQQGITTGSGPSIASSGTVSPTSVTSHVAAHDRMTSPPADFQQGITTGSCYSSASNEALNPTSPIATYDRVMPSLPPRQHTPSILADLVHEEAESVLLARCEDVFRRTLSRTPQWKLAGRFPDNTAVHCYRPCVHDGFLYAVVSLTGAGNAAHLFSCPLSSDVVGAWSAMPLPSDGQWHWKSYLVSHADLLYALLIALDRTGFYRLFCTSDLHSWQPVAALDRVMFKFGVHVHASSLYVIGGDDGDFGGRSRKSVRRLDLSSPHGGWVRMPRLPAVCVLPHVVTVGDSIHCVGHSDGAGTHVNDVVSLGHPSPERCEPSWTMDRIPGPPVAGFGAAVLNGNLVIAGGESADGKKGVASVFVYCGDAGRWPWMPLPPLNTDARYPRCFSWNNALYCLAGNDIMRFSV